jgi:energy-coupling factor transporter ATP-binding protein EcfA2
MAHDVERTLMEDIRATLAKEKDFAVKQEAVFDVQYPTGFPVLDYTIGQRVHVIDDANNEEFDYDSIGIVDGSYNLVIGRSGCGKSTFIKQASANIIAPFPNGLIFEDSIEGGVTMSRNEFLIGMSTSQITKRMSIRNSGISTESCYKRIKTIYDIKTQTPEKYTYDTGLYDSSGHKIYKMVPTVYIIDSLAMLMPEKLTQEEELSGQMSSTAAAKQIARFFKQVIPLLKGSNIILFVVNHITQTIDINPYQHTKTHNIYLDPGETCPGGVTPFYLANNIFKLYDNTKLSEDKELGICGNFVTFKIIKSRTSRSGVTTDLVFNQDTGFDSELSLYIMLKKEGLIKGAGAFLYLDGYPEQKFAQRNLKALLQTNEEFAQRFVELCYIVLHNSIKTPKMLSADENSNNTGVMSRLNNMIAAQYSRQ